MNNLAISEKQLNQFASQQWDKTLAFLQGTYSLSRVDCEDIFQESFILMYDNIISGKLNKLTSTLAVYFNGICKNKALEKLRENGKTVNLIDEYPETMTDEFQDDQIDRLLALEQEDDSIEIRKAAIVRQIVKNLPAPCDKLLWAFYRDGFSMKTMASMFNYKSEEAVKVTKHRCNNKFKNKFTEIANQLFD